MSKTVIAIITISTAIVAAVVFFTLREPPGMDDIYVVSSQDIGEIIPREKEGREFPASGPGVYLVIPVDDVLPGDMIRVEWAYDDGSGYEIIQKDRIEIEDDGSGHITVYLLKRDSVYAEGDYMAKAYYNDRQEKQASFTITSSQVSNP